MGLALHEVSKHISEFPCGSPLGFPGFFQWKLDPPELFPVGKTGLNQGGIGQKAEGQDGFDGGLCFFGFSHEFLL